MTEEKKIEFINWLDRIVGLTRALKDIKKCNIDELDEFAGICCSMENVHLNDEAFEYAIECLEPVIEERIVEYSHEKYKHKRLSFMYRNMEIMTLLDMGGEE